MDLPTTGTMAWFDVNTTDLSKAKTFFSKVLGWTYSEMAPGYWVIQAGANGIGGLNEVPSAQFKTNEGGFTPYFSVPSVKEATTIITGAGGKLAGEPTPINGGANGHFLWFKDLDGNKLALWSKKP